MPARFATLSMVDDSYDRSLNLVCGSGFSFIVTVTRLWKRNGIGVQTKKNEKTSPTPHRQKHSCQTALVKLIDQWMTCIDRGVIVGSVFLDFRKAFDLVDHSILIDKLFLYKCQGPDLNLISSYLQSRQQVIDSGKGLSTPAYIKSGVPQGSILGPTLFFIFINDLPLHMEYCDIDLFADDATFHANGKTKSEVEPKLQTDGNNSKSWAKHHKMQIHYDKTSCMTLGSRHRTQNEASKLDITIDGNEIKQVDEQKLLGAYIDENLLWTTHIDYLCSTISTKISLLKQLSAYTSQNKKRRYI